MDKHYSSETLEKRWLHDWASEGAFAKTEHIVSDDCFTIIMPPPNVTGALHLGHALTFTIQDVLMRYHRMCGQNVWWQPGLDHAGIATQMVVERQLWAQNKTTRHDCGRETFLEQVWQWKEQSGNRIVEQLTRLGASTDWSHTQFTMDPKIQDIVRKIFVQLHRDGLIYRAKRLVNWDPQLQTALSDLEVVNQETQGNLYYIAYSLEGDALVVATTRPETLFGDTAIAVHPDDPRYRHYIGQHVTIPLTDRRIPVIADDAVDMDQGSGAVKITPAHDFNDYQMGLRHHLAMITIMDEHARLNGESVPVKYHGQDRFDARKDIVADLESQGFLIRTEAIKHAVPHGDRSGVILEPRLTDQWFLDAAKLAPAALDAVRQGHTVFAPAHWQHLYEEWLSNIQPWCLSRQIWWGHRIPAWYGPDGHVFIAESQEEAAEQAAVHYGTSCALAQDNDVLDTWFSSGLWPFATLGWPDETPDLMQRYPSDVLVTGFDIIFFWVARMMMLGMYVMKRPPFKAVYIHGLIRDAHGQKMSKTKGNVVDPLALIQEYGADAMRFALMWSISPGRDILFSEERIQWARHFMTKIWNAARYIQMQEEQDENPAVLMDHRVCTPNPQHIFNRWMLMRVAQLSQTIHRAMASYHVHEYARHIYHELWDVFCDWYIELSKPLLMEDQWRDETHQTLRYAWAQLLRLAHPIIPFVTQELWVLMGLGDRCITLSHDIYQDKSLEDAQIQIEMRWLQSVITEIRSVRNQLRVPASQRLDVTFIGVDPQAVQFWHDHMSMIARMARVQNSALESLPTEQRIEIYVMGSVIHMALGGSVDLCREHARLLKEYAELDRDIKSMEQRLHNPEFCARAPADVLEQTQKNHQQRTEQRILTRQWLDRLQQWEDKKSTV